VASISFALSYATILCKTIGGFFKEREYNGKKYIDFEVLIYK
jgi:hypothetical protein